MLNQITKIEVQGYHPVKTIQAQKNGKVSFIFFKKKTATCLIEPSQILELIGRY